MEAPGSSLESPLLTDEEFDALQRFVQAVPISPAVEDERVDPAILYAHLRQLIEFGRYWRGKALEDSSALRDSQSTEAGG